MGNLQLARILVTIPAIFLAIGPPVADLNATHVVNPLWSAHARLHTVWLICTNSMIAVVALGLVWRRPRAPERGPILLAVALLGCVLLGFLVAAATRSAYGGAFTDPNGIAFQIGPLDANLAVFSLLAGLLVLTAAIARDRPA